MRFWIVVIVFIIIISLFTYFSNIMILPTIEKMNNYIDKIIADVENDRFENAKVECKEMIKYWNTRKKVWATLIDHQEIDNIESNLTRILKITTYKDKSDIIGEASQLKFYVIHIKERIILSFENIF
ncbi:DUF4363 family protein [Caldicellulosiruptoraceae bacterium PP1]